MELEEISKKNWQQNATASAQPPISLSESDLNEQPEESGLLARVESAAPASGLQQFFTGQTFATEEDYIQGLSDRDRRAETETVRWLTFMLGREEYALSLEVVLELIKPRFLTDLPKVPDYIRGILSLRGVVVPVIDLRRRLNLGQGEEESGQRIIICAGPEQSIGLLVDRIVQVVRLPKEAIETAPLVLSNLAKKFVTAIGRTQGRMLILLDPEEILKI